MLADLPVLLAPLLPAGQHRRVAEERRNTVTGQSAKGKEGEAGVGESQALAAWLAAAERWRDDRMRRAEEIKQSLVSIFKTEASSSQARLSWLM